MDSSIDFMDLLAYNCGRDNSKYKRRNYLCIDVFTVKKNFMMNP